MPPFLTVLEAAVANPDYNDLLPLLLGKFFQEGGSFHRLPRTPLHTVMQESNPKGLTILLDKLDHEYRGQHLIKYGSMIQSTDIHDMIS